MFYDTFPLPPPLTTVYVFKVPGKKGKKKIPTPFVLTLFFSLKSPQNLAYSITVSDHIPIDSNQCR